MVYPATTHDEARQLDIQNANQFHQILQGDIDTEIDTYEGLGKIPSVAKAMFEAAAYRLPLDWEEGVDEVDLLQPRLYEGNVYVPVFVPAPMLATPDNANWRLYRPVTGVVQMVERHLGSELSGNSLILDNQYVPGNNNIQVFVNRSLWFPGEDFTEVSATRIDFINVPGPDDEIIIYVGQMTTTQYDPSFTGSTLRSWVFQGDGGNQYSILGADSDITEAYIVFIDGARLIPNVSYTVDSTTDTITFANSYTAQQQISVLGIGQVIVTDGDGDATLRQELARSTGAEMVGYGAETVASKLLELDNSVASGLAGGAPMWGSIGEGLDNTVVGQFFTVPGTGDDYSILYRHDPGDVATEVSRTSSASYTQETRALVEAPLNVGVANGWIDPFFRHLGIGETLGGQFRWYGGGAIDGPMSTLEYVDNPVFKGRALRKNTDGTVQLAGPLVSLADMGAAVGDTVTARMLVIGDGETVYFVGRWVDADGASVSGQIDGDTDTVSASPTLFSMTDVVPAGAAYLRLYPYTDTVGGQFDIVALWAGKGSAGEVPVWPNYNDIDYLLNKTAQSTTDYVGQGNGWIDPFFRHLEIGEEIGDQQRWHIIGGGSLSLVDNPVFKGRALRKTGEGMMDLSGPLISVKDMSAEEGDSVAVRMLVIGNGAEVVATGRWVDASGVFIGTQDDAGSVIAGAEPVLISWFLTVPAGAAYFRLYPYTNTVGGQFDILALWAGTGDVPSLPLYNDIDYLLLKAGQSGGSATVPDLALPPFIYHAGDRQINTYFANMTYATAGQYQWDVDCARGDQLQECHRIEGGESVSTVPITIKQQDPVSFQDLKVATGTLRMASDTAGNGVTRKLMVIGDSTTANGKMVTEIVNLFGSDVMSVTMVGTQGTAPNVHEGRSGWKTTDYTGPGRTFFEFTVSGVVEEPAINATEYDHNGSTYEVQEVNLDGNGDGTLICERRSGSNDPLASGTLTKSNASDGDATISFSAWQTVAGNPFWNDGTEQLDFSAYMSANGFAMTAGDWVMIHLGINDCFAETTDAGVDVLTNAAFPALDGLIASIRAYEPGIRIGMCVPVPPPSSQDAFAVYSSGQTRHRYMRNIHRWALNLIDYYSGQEGSGNYIIPLNTCWDTVNNAMIVTENVNSRSTTQVGRQKNGVHPHNGGYEQMADCIYSVIKYHE